MSEIGIRAANAIRAMAKKNSNGIGGELDRLCITAGSLCQYSNNVADPGAWVLKTMAQNGYDVLYILTGERK